jgi:hypothetical protein
MSNIISRLQTKLASAALANDHPDVETRYMGGRNRDNQPFISGYHQVWFELPEKLFSGDINTDNISKWLRSTCENFTPHSVTMNMVDVMGTGQIASSFPASKTVNREFTLGFREYRKLPILNIFRLWQGMFDEHLGVSSLTANEFVPKNYKGLVAVAILKPTVQEGDGRLTLDDIEEGYIYDGVVPLTVPEDTVTASDQGTNETVQASVTFRFDGAPLTIASDKAKTFFERTLLSNFNYYNTYDHIYTSLGVS